MPKLYCLFSRGNVLFTLIAILHYTHSVFASRTTLFIPNVQQPRVVGPADVTACSANYGMPTWTDCDNAIQAMRNNVRPEGYSTWQPLEREEFDFGPREFKREGDRSSRNWPNGPLVEVPLAWTSGTCLISITLKANNPISDLSNWNDVWAKFQTLNRECTSGAASGGSKLIGENNRVRLEIYGTDTKLKKAEKLKKLCLQGAEYQDLPQCNSDESVTETISIEIIQEVQQANRGAPLVQGQCAANAYSLSNGGACNGFVYDLINLSKNTLGVLFGVPSSVSWATTGAFVLSAAAGFVDGGSG